MKAIRVHEFGGPEVLRLEDVPTPQPGPGQVLGRMPVIGKEFPLAEAAQTHRAVMEPRAAGKIVLVPGK